MTRITWDETQNRFYETGVQRGVLYSYNPVSKKYDDYEVWNGLSKVTESPDGGDESAIYSDNQKYLSLTSAEVLKGTIESYTYPKTFESYNGAVGFPGVLIGQQVRKKFGMVYTTLIGNTDTDTSIGNDYLIHVVYGAKVSPSEREYETINDNPNAITFSWKFTTTPEYIKNLKPTASLVFDTRYMSAASIKKIEDTLYGSSDKAPVLPSPSELLSMYQPNLLTGALGASYNINDVIGTGRWNVLEWNQPSIFNDFNNSIRDYDGQQLVLSCDVDLTFKDVNIPSSITSIVVYLSQRCAIEGNEYTFIDQVNEANTTPYTVPLGNNIQTGTTYTVHLHQTFTMNPKVLALISFQTGLRIDPTAPTGTNLVFDANIYNVTLEVKHDDNTTEATE